MYLNIKKGKPIPLTNSLGKVNEIITYSVRNKRMALAATNFSACSHNKTQVGINTSPILEVDN